MYQVHFKIYIYRYLIHKNNQCSCKTFGFNYQLYLEELAVLCAIFLFPNFQNWSHNGQLHQRSAPRGESNLTVAGMWKSTATIIISFPLATSFSSVHPVHIYYKEHRAERWKLRSYAIDSTITGGCVLHIQADPSCRAHITRNANSTLSFTSLLYLTIVFHLLIFRTSRFANRPLQNTKGRCNN